MTRVENPIRRGQLIAPFGVGAMVVGKSGIAMVTAALDYWYRKSDGTRQSEDSLQEFRVEEWRLQRRLGVDHFRLPPDWREMEAGNEVPNPYLAIPFLKFPTWFTCRKCGRLEQSKSTDRKAPECPSCGWRGRMVQVPIVAVCRRGHLMEFPWREWVHRGPTDCTRPMKLVSRTGATLASKVVKCECDKGREGRSLSGVTTILPEGMTIVSRDLMDDGSLYQCKGTKTWAGDDVHEECNEAIQGTLRNALNVYYADVESALYLPVGSGSLPKELVELIATPAAKSLRNFAALLEKGTLSEKQVVEEVVSLLVQDLPTLEQLYQRDVIAKAVVGILHPETLTDGAEDQFSDETVFRHEEHLALQVNRRSSDLVTKASDVVKYGELADYLSCVTLVEKLKETRVLNGFGRIVPPNDTDFQLRQQLMWREPPSPQNSWLPAQVVYGEGIYLALDEEKLQSWESRPDVARRVARLTEMNSGATPRMMLVHTLSHLLMNQLTFSCGYSSATLRERLYTSEDERTLMAGVLIYTAEGDADGTLGGLVRMGLPEKFVPVFLQALANAQWCSADPVCMESGAKGGQGPGSQNLAACHSCALVPETACESFNRYLDRSLVVGTPENPELGFFADLLSSLPTA